VQLHSWDLSTPNSQPGETGWAVIDPGEVVAVVWDSEPKALGGPVPVSGTLGGA